MHRQRVPHAMRGRGWRGLAPGPATSPPHPAPRIYPYRLRGVTAAHPHHVWGIAIPYIRLHGTWLDLVAVRDWFSRYVVRGERSDTRAWPLVAAAARRALAPATPVVEHHDSGRHFTSPQYTARSEATGVQTSLEGRGRALDNIFTERLWRRVKYEAGYLHEYRSPREARHHLSRSLTFYNPARAPGVGLPDAGGGRLGDGRVTHPPSAGRGRGYPGDPPIQQGFSCPPRTARSFSNDYGCYGAPAHPERRESGTTIGRSAVWTGGSTLWGGASAPNHRSHGLQLTAWTLPSASTWLQLRRMRPRRPPCLTGLTATVYALDAYRSLP